MDGLASRKCALMGWHDAGIPPFYPYIAIILPLFNPYFHTFFTHIIPLLQPYTPQQVSAASAGRVQVVTKLSPPASVLNHLPGGRSQVVRPHTKFTSIVETRQLAIAYSAAFRPTVWTRGARGSVSDGAVGCSFHWEGGL